MGVAKRSFSPETLIEAKTAVGSDPDASDAESDASNFWAQLEAKDDDNEHTDAEHLDGQRDIRSYFKPVQERAAAAKLLCVICGPSGAGKSTVIQRLMAEFPDRFGFCVSHTTRAPRVGERDGIEYHFVSKEEMQRRIANGEFLEYAEVHGNHYGTSIAAVRGVTKKEQVCLLDIDIQGAEAVRSSELHLSAAYIFLAPPSLEVLEARLRSRGTETEEKILKRLSGAQRELAALRAAPEKWGKTLVNDDAEEAYRGFRAFLQPLILEVVASQSAAPGTPPKKRCASTSLPGIADGTTPPKRPRPQASSLAEDGAPCKLQRLEEGQKSDQVVV